MRFTDSQRRRLVLAVLCSLLAHALLLSLAFSGPGSGTPGLGLNWRERWVEAQEVRVVMVPARVPAEQPRSTQPPADEAKVQAAAAPLKPAPPAPSEAVAAPGTAAVAQDTEPTPTVTPDARAMPDAAEPTQAAVPPDPTSRLGILAPGSAAPATTMAADKITLDPSRPKPWAAPGELPLPLPLPIPVAAAAPAPSAPSASSPERTLPASIALKAEALARIAPPAPERTLDLSQLDTSARVAQKQIEQLQAASAEVERQDAAREQAARQLAAELAARQEAARQKALRQEAARAEAARVAAEGQELARQEAARQDAARQEAVQREAARQAAALQEAVRARAEQADADAARREASRRAMGRQLDEEAARRREAEAAAAMTLPPTASAAARQPAPLPLSWSTARRGRLLGRADPNAELVLYAEAWARKIQLNTSIEQVRELAQQRHTSPLVTVALRQDGSVESVTVVVSSGVPQIDEAITRIVQAQAPYLAFPPALARDFDVVEIRRSWTFDTAVRLY